MVLEPGETLRKRGPHWEELYLDTVSAMAKNGAGGLLGRVQIEEGREGIVLSLTFVNNGGGKEQLGGKGALWLRVARLNAGRNGEAKATKERMGEDIKDDLAEAGLFLNLGPVVVDKPPVGCRRIRSRKDGAGVPTRKGKGAEELAA
jgi:hypothetical protein